MAERHRARQLEAKEYADVLDEAAKTQQPWMNGWPRMSLQTMLVGSGVECVCCGRCRGVTCVAIDPDWIAPPPITYPFSEADCPLCRSGGVL
jgi:hypothetical protein